ncbi:ABC transporter ATP-binding protein [Peribacillus sp. NPDC097295]|uniref:ABC transporter ATP-binding protein n=1 Tax=Peribacillus sp. NPDC097295 TaxID=3364402 RepID=UPI0037F13F43
MSESIGVEKVELKHDQPDRDNQNQEALLVVNGLKKTYRSSGFRKQVDPVLQGVTFSLMPGETVGLVGASGAGKSTIGRIIAGLENADGGQVFLEGKDLLSMKAKERRLSAKSIQMVFQDPYESLSSLMTIEQLVAEPLVIQKLESDRFKRKKLVQKALNDVALAPEKYMNRYPHQLSGGERQRVGLARAFICQPRLIIADEPTSMLDTSLRLDLLQLMREMGRRYGVSYLFVTHDIALTRSFCDRLIVLDRGKIVESGCTSDVIDHPAHPFTKSLIEALLELEHY